jgi:peptidoglycan/LPS O-acetylase OafA/YrhL
VDRRLVYGAISGVIIVALAQAEREGRWRATGAWVKPLGDASYALYLLHIPIISLACKLLPRASVSGPLTGIAAFAAVYALCLAVSTAYHLRIERPMLAFLADAARRHGPIPGGRHGTVPGTTQGTIPGNAEGLGHRGVAPTRGGGA